MPDSPESSAPASVARSTSLIAAFTLVSRVLGLARDVVIANVFGVSRVTEAFFVANKIPNMLRRFFAEGAFSQAFVPVTSEYKQSRSQSETADFVASVAGTLGVFLLILSIVGVVLAPVLVMIFAPGFTGDDRYTMTSTMLRFTFPYVFFISLTALAGGVLNSYGRFAIPALTPALLNICIIGCAIWLAPNLAEPGLALAIGVLLSGIAQLAIQLPALSRIGMLRWPRIAWRDSGVRKVGRLMLPALFGSSVAQINMLIDTVIASTLAAGSVSWLYYSDRLMEFPLGVFGIALATVILPRLSRQHTGGNRAEFSATLDKALRMVLLIGIPATAGLICLASPLMVTIFFGGEFSVIDTRMASASLVAFALGLPAFMLVKVLAPGYFSRQDTRTPVRFAMVALLVNLVLNLVFVMTLRNLGYAHEHAGLAAATAVAAAVNAALLYQGLRGPGYLQQAPGWLRLMLSVALACAVMVAGLVMLSPPLTEWLEMLVLQRVASLLGLVAYGGLSYIFIMYLCGYRPADFSPGNETAQ